MKFKEALGIDVSKKTLDVLLHIKGVHRQFDNTTKGHISLIAWMKKQTGFTSDQVMICFEHTGLYSLPLAVFLKEHQVKFFMVAALEIKRSLGIVRGKNDKVDAKRIAGYAFLRRETLKPFELPSKNILKLQKLVSLRDKLVIQRGGYKAGMKEYKAMLKQKEYEILVSTHSNMIESLTQQIDIIEKGMTAIIEGDKEIKRLYDLVVSVKGIGFVLASNLMVVTNCFMSFTDSRKFACYAGLAPFERQSGTSLNSRSRVSHYANKKMKALLNMAAFSTIQDDQELKAYYQRRVKDGKSKMSTINIVRNKIVHRIFAVVKRGTPYVPLYKHAV